MDNKYMNNQTHITNTYTKQYIFLLSIDPCITNFYVTLISYQTTPYVLKVKAI